MVQSAPHCICPEKMLFPPNAGVEVLAQYDLTPEERAAQQRESVIVAVRSGHLMATAFHPELTSDARLVVP